ncbi:Avirulence (Avh) protein [Phytophthora megakarya]|uniref:RxLR effector protein n=1 Tax=Phytophthora megakarya TaxID=4795 RepID=A0A225VS19_9STRA|nr:Avirulence (Avh) protein [Phytophthora megakarya]
MRMTYVLTATVATVLANFDCTSASTSSSDGVGRIESKNGFLRIREMDDGNELSYEERAGMPEKVIDATKKLSKGAKWNKLDDGTGALMLDLKNLEAKNINLFKKIEDMGYTPYSIHQKLGIKDKVKHMTQAQLNNDPSYLLWLDFSRYWKGTYGKDFQHLG